MPPSTCFFFICLSRSYEDYPGFHSRYRKGLGLLNHQEQAGGLGMVGGQRAKLFSNLMLHGQGDSDGLSEEVQGTVCSILQGRINPLRFICYFIFIFILLM